MEIIIQVHTGVDRRNYYNKIGVVYFDQLLGAVRTQKLAKTFFSAIFNLFCSFFSFFSDFMAEITKKNLKINMSHAN